MQQREKHYKRRSAIGVVALDGINSHYCESSQRINNCMEGTIQIETVKEQVKKIRARKSADKVNQISAKNKKRLDLDAVSSSRYEDSISDAAWQKALESVEMTMEDNEVEKSAETMEEREAEVARQVEAETKKYAEQRKKETKRAGSKRSLPTRWVRTTNM